MGVLDQFKANFVSSTRPQENAQAEPDRERVARMREAFSLYLGSQVALMRGTPAKDREGRPVEAAKSWYPKPSAQHPGGLELPLQYGNGSVVVGHAADGKPLDAIWATNIDEMAEVATAFRQEVAAGQHDAILLDAEKRRV